VGLFISFLVNRYFQIIQYWISQILLLFGDTIFICVKGIRNCPFKMYLFFTGAHSYFLLLTIPSKLSEIVTLVTCIWDVLALNLDQDTGLSPARFLSFSLVLHTWVG
jgi:hypothetical protein